MEFFKLDYTLSVFKKELKLIKPVEREVLTDDLNLKHHPDSSRPILMYLVTEF